MLREPLLLPALAFSAGILAAHFYFFELSDLVFPAVLAGCVLATACLAHQAQRWRIVCASIVFSLAGMGSQIVHRQGPAPELNASDGELVVLQGCVIDPPVFSPSREQFTLQLKPGVSARITVTLKDNEGFPLNYGQPVEVMARIRSPRNYQNPGSFDYVSYLARQHIYWTGSVRDKKEIHILPGHCASPAIGWLYSIRTWALERLRLLYPGDQQTTALLQAVLLGETSGVERRWTSDFRLTGTYHALVISGQHISILAFSLLMILRLFQVRKIPALCLATLAGWLYAFISGMSSPVVRAAGGFTLFLIASYCFRRTRILNALAAVALVYLFFDPDLLFDPSFQLSFLSAAAIAVFAAPALENFTEPIRNAIKRFDQIRYDASVEPKAAEWRVELRLLAETLRLWTHLPEKAVQWLVIGATLLFVYAAEAVIISACVQFGLALPMVAYFHRLSLTGLSANIIVIPLLSLVVPLGFASILTGWPWLALITKIFLHWAEWVAGWHTHLEPSWRIAAIPLGVSLAFAISSVLWAITIRHGRSWAFLSGTCALFFFGVIWCQPWKPELKPHMLEVTAIDVSQGDSLLLVFPDGETMLVDAGGFPGMGKMTRKPQMDMGEDVVSPYLWSRRIRHLDYAVLTHGHSDHMDGLAAILDNFHPKTLWIGPEPETDSWKVVREHAAVDGVVIKTMNRISPSVQIGGTRVRVLAPSPDYVPGDAPANNDSLVLEITYGRRSVLLTGDAERPIEDDLLAHEHLHPVTLLKVGHHGSRTSSSEEFLGQIHPQLAFISDGYLNQFHHPHPDVLARLQDHHTAVWRTDVNGLITFRTDGDKIELESFR